MQLVTMHRTPYREGTDERNHYVTTFAVTEPKFSHSEVMGAVRSVAADLGMQGRNGLQFASPLFNGAHDTEQVAAVDLSDVFGGISLLQQRPRQVGEL